MHDRRVKVTINNFAFAKAGTYAYYCRYHGGQGGAGMSGQIVVE